MNSTQNDKMVVDIFNYFYPNNTITAYELNDDIRDTAAKMYAEALDASFLMSLVPQLPQTSLVTWLYLDEVKTLWATKKGADISEGVRSRIALDYM